MANFWPFPLSNSAPRVSFLAALVVSVGACSADPECTVTTDCPSDKVCQQEMCVDKPGYQSRRRVCDGGNCGGLIFPDAQTIPVIDAGMTSTTADGSQTSTSGMNLDGGGGGNMGTNDGAVTYDGGIYDGPALPIIDGGSSYDGGHPTPQALGNEGLIWIGEIDSEGGRATSVGAIFDDNAGALFGITRHDFVVAGGNCSVVQRRLSSGAPVGITAQSIVIDYTDNPHAQPLSLMSPSNNGRFGAAMLPSPPLFLDHRPVNFSIVSNGSIGGLLGHMAAVSVPETPRVVSPTSAGNGFSMSSNPRIEWLPRPASGANLEFVAELADAGRNVVLSCKVGDSTGALQIPTQALQAWSLSSPTAPARLELRYDQSVTEAVGRSGGFIVDTIFRVSRGQGHPLLP